MGFIPDVRRIISAMPKQRQSLLFSATMPKEIVRFANEILDQPIRIDVSPKEVTVAKIEQYAIAVRNAQKRAALETLLRDKQMQLEHNLYPHKARCEQSLPAIERFWFLLLRLSTATKPKLQRDSVLYKILNMARLGS